MCVSMILTGCNNLNTEVQESESLSETTANESTAETEATTAASEDDKGTAEQETSESETEEAVDYILGDLVYSEITTEEVFDKLIADDVLSEEVYMLSWTTEIVSDGVNITKDGITEAYHIEGILDISLPFTDLLNQMDEQKQIDILNTIANTYKDAIAVDIVRITCAGESVITDLVNYDVMILESELERIKPELIDEIADEAYFEEDNDDEETAE